MASFDATFFQDREGNWCVSWTSPEGKRQERVKLRHYGAEYALPRLLYLTMGDEVAQRWLGKDWLTP